MMTPQEVAEHVFEKAWMGGYSMSMVDEFLDLLTEDYTTLYKDNTILKNKLKVLSETVEQYRATDNAMRQAFYVAQQSAEAMVKEAEQKQAELLAGAEATAHERLANIKAQIAEEEAKLQSAKAATAAFVQQVIAATGSLSEGLSRLTEIVDNAPAPAAVADDPAPTLIDFPTVHEVVAQVAAEPVADELPDEAVEPVFSPEEEEEAAPAEEVDPFATRRFENLQFGKDYEIQ